MIRNLIFDMDGTLADTAVATIPTCTELAVRCGLPIPTAESIRAAIGIANPDFYYRLFPHHERSVIYEYGQRVERAEADIIRKIGEGILFPGVRGLLERLTRLGCALYIASTGDREHVDVVLRSAGVMEFFREIHCGESEKVRMVAGILGDSDRSEWVVVGDRDKDARAAHENGILALAAGFGYCERADWPLFDAVLKTPGELVDWVYAG